MPLSTLLPETFFRLLLIQGSPPASLKAGIPILLYGVDYKKRRIQCTRTIIPDGNIDSQMREIKLYFKDFTGKKPEKFTIGEI